MEAMLVIAICGIAAGLATYAIAQEVRRERIVHGDRSHPRRNLQTVVDWLARHIDRMPLGSAHAWLATRCLHAGYEDRLDPARMIARSVLLSVSLIFLFNWWRHTLTISSTAVGGVLGFFLAGVWLIHKTRSRRAAIECALPTTMDMLTLSVEAGMDFAQALSQIAMASKANALTHEIERLIAEIKLGVTRAEALKRLADRLAMPTVTALASTLIQADRLGAPIGPALRAHASRVRGERMMRGEKAGAVAAQKALIPLVVCIMPVTFIVIFGPLAARYLTGGFDHLLR